LQFLYPHRRFSRRLERADLQAKHDEAQFELDKVIEELTLDVTI